MSHQFYPVKIQTLESDKQKEEREKAKVLGRKNVSDLSASSITQTKAAYKDRFKDGINSFGQNRGLQLEQLILQNEDGERVVVNAERPRTFENLTKGEKKRVDRVLRWKDLHRIPDKSYPPAKSSGLPPASHIKQQEKLVDEKLAEIHQVRFRLRCRISIKDLSIRQAIG